jgi:hypothetical protein
MKHEKLEYLKLIIKNQTTIVSELKRFRNDKDKQLEKHITFQDGILQGLRKALKIIK